MVSHPAGWSLRQRQKNTAIDDDADDLVAAYGAHAYEEARRRKHEANSLSEAHYWHQVKTKLGRRIVERRQPAELAKLATEVFAYLDSASDNRARARELARAIEGVRGTAVDHPAVDRAEKCLSFLETHGAVFDIIEADIAAIAGALADGGDSRESAPPAGPAAEDRVRTVGIREGHANASSSPRPGDWRHP